MSVDKKKIDEFLVKGLFKIINGRISILKDIDYIMYPTRGVVVNFQQVGEDLGADFVYDLGYEMGKKTKKILNENISSLKNYLPEKFQSIYFLLEITGHGMISTIKQDENKISFKVSNNKSLEFGKSLYKKKSYVAEHYAGYYLAFFDFPKECLRKIKSGKSYSFEYERK